MDHKVKCCSWGERVITRYKNYDVGAATANYVYELNIYDNEGEFLEDEEIYFCPRCGIKLAGLHS